MLLLCCLSLVAEYVILFAETGDLFATSSVLLKEVFKVFYYGSSL